MKINNLKQFEKMLEFCFSSEFNQLDESEQLNLKNMIKDAIENIDGAICKMKAIAKEELQEGDFDERWTSSRLRKEKILFVISTISDEDKIYIITQYMQGPKEDDETYWRVEKEMLFDMLEYLSEDLQIETLSKANPVELFKIMSSYNNDARLSIANSKRYFLKKQKNEDAELYRKRYNICKQALAK